MPAQQHAASISRGAYPTDAYTPHGYLATPDSFATSWSDGVGGNLRSTPRAIGFGWVYPWARDAVAGVQLEIGLAVAPDTAFRAALTRVDFEGQSEPPTATHHSALLFEYRCQAFGARVRARFTPIGPDDLGLQVEITPADDPLPLGLTLYLAAVAWRKDGGTCRGATRAETTTPIRGLVDIGPPYPVHQLIVDASASVLSPMVGRTLADCVGGGRPDASDVADGQVAVGVAIPLASGGAPGIPIAAILRRAPSRRTARPLDRPADVVSAAVVEAGQRDHAFWRGAARLQGDWPDAWRRGWVYDVETTRMCMLPAGGVFSDVWPTWMIQWPRAVVAEGTLDALRLVYADPELAKRAALTLFRDAPAPNVPCIFRGGEPNMVARDGSVCGTSPAWCIPLYNLERLYLHTLDRAWLAEIYPPLARYLDWWLRERVDAEGWSVYKCTWEAGEDDTPRLDPERRGDNVVSEYVRPVELQATIALSASVLARFAETLGHSSDAARWREVAEAFAARTRSLWDAAAGRFRDWDRRAENFLEPGGTPNYWGIDPCRYSALAFTPLLAGLVDEDQARALGDELERYSVPPWTLWPSWSYVLLESALAAGVDAWAGRLADEIVRRVYAELDRRAADPAGGPTPGIAREYWPLDLNTWDACEGYGWGATTATFVVRQIFGFREGDDRSGLRFRLAPALPTRFLEAGRRYGVVNLPYRGDVLDLEYTILDAGGPGLEVRVAARGPTTCRVTDRQGNVVHESAGVTLSHRFVGQPGPTYDIELSRR